MWVLGTELRSSKEQPMLLPTVIYCETANADAHRTSHRAQMEEMDQQVPQPLESMCPVSSPSVASREGSPNTAHFLREIRNLDFYCLKI